MTKARRKRTKETDEEKCRRKLRHPDYLSALLQARSLADPAIVIYPCCICGGLHLGHNSVRDTEQLERERKMRVASLLRRIERHSRIIAEHTQIKRRFEDKLEETLILYDSAA